LDNQRKELRRQKEEYELKVKELNKKLNTLTTSVENTKTDL
jgi:hypothetical protein